MTQRQSEAVAIAAPIIILSGCLISMLTFGPRSAMGFFQIPIITEHGWGRDIFSLGIAIQNLLWGVGQPFAGAVADRFGTVRVLTAGAILYAAGLALMSFSSDPGMFTVTAGVLIGFGLSGCSFNLVLAAFGKLLPAEKRSMAFGFGTAAGSFGQVLFAPLSVGLLQVTDWHTTLYFYAALILLVAPLSLALATRGRSVNTTGAKGVGAGTTVGRDKGIVGTLTEAFGHPSYVFLVIGFFTCGFQLAFITTHFPPYLADLKMPAYVGAWALALIGLFNIFGSLASGWAASRVSKRWLLAWIYFGRAAAVIGLLVLPAHPAVALGFAALMGLLWLSTIPPTSGLVALMFGTRYMGMLYGFAFFSHQVGGFLGVYLGGVLYERTGSYDIVWWLGALLAVGSGLINLPIKEKPFDRPLAQQAA